jgi:hypothetical protein
MYNTRVGIRVLEGAERRLFVETLAMLFDDVSMEDEPPDSGPYYGLQRNQKIFVLHTVARALLFESEPTPQLTAAIEAAVAAVFERAGSVVSLELSGEFGADTDFPDLPSWRELVLAACHETGIADELTNVQQDDPDDWVVLLECLEGRLLWDSDWEMDEQLDADPDAAGGMKDFLGIDRDYFVDVPPEPSDAEADRLLAELRSLTRVAK